MERPSKKTDFLSSVTFNEADLVPPLPEVPEIPLPPLEKKSQSVVMILRGLPDGRLTEFDGFYLKDFDFEAFDGLGNITMTPDVEIAKRFKNHGEALDYIGTQPKCRLFQADGRPNKPLTATNWELQWVDDPLMN